MPQTTTVLAGGGWPSTADLSTAPVVTVRTPVLRLAQEKYQTCPGSTGSEAPATQNTSKEVVV